MALICHAAEYDITQSRHVCAAQATNYNPNVDEQEEITLDFEALRESL